VRTPTTEAVTDREMASQKLEYMHLNPLQPHWLLCSNPVEYKFSSAIYYEQDVDVFELLTHFREAF
jgi:putative transposase